MKSKTRIAISAVSAILMASSIAYADDAIRSYSKDITVHYGIRVSLEGEYVDLIDSNGKVVDAFTYQDTAYVPLKTLAPMLGGTTNYDPSSNTVNVHDSDDYITSLYANKVERLEETLDKYQELIALLIQQDELLSDSENYVQQNTEIVDMYSEYYLDYYNLGNERLDAINNGTASNQDAWQQLYDSMGNLLSNASQNAIDSMQTSGDSTNRINSYTFPLHLYSNDGKVYLGKCVTDTRDKDSIWYGMVGGDYSSEYSQTSIWNEYSEYGSSLIGKNNSAFNDKATTPPKIVDNNGSFVAYLTTNSKIDNGWTIEELRQFVVNNGQ